MIRIFITTDFNKAIGLYSDSSIEWKSINEDFKNLPYSYQYNSKYLIIIEKDANVDWIKYNINKDGDDYILVHESSGLDEKEIIKNNFGKNKIKLGSHIAEFYHDKVFKVLFGNGNNKPQRILKELGFTNEDISEKENFNSKINLLHKCLSPETINLNTKEDISKLNKEEMGAYLNFLKKVKQIKDPFDKQYISALITLRTSFLSRD